MFKEVLGDQERPHLWLLHGSAAPPASLSGLAADLAREFCVHLPHFPGYERTPYAPEDSISTSASELAEFISQIERPVVLIGHSFGLYRAIQILKQLDAHLVAGLYSLSGVSTLPEEQRESFVQAEAWARSGHQIPEGLAVRWFSNEYLESHPEVVSRISGWWASCNIEAVARELYEPFDGGDANRVLAASQQPTLFRVGTLDTTTPAKHSYSMATLLQNAPVELVEGAGHFLHLEDSGSTLASIRSFARTCFSARDHSHE